MEMSMGLEGRALSAPGSAGCTPDQVHPARPAGPPVLPAAKRAADGGAAGAAAEPGGDARGVRLCVRWVRQRSASSLAAPFHLPSFFFVLLCAQLAGDAPFAAPAACSPRVSGPCCGRPPGRPAAPRKEPPGLKPCCTPPHHPAAARRGGGRVPHSSVSGGGCEHEWRLSSGPAGLSGRSSPRHSGGGPAGGSRGSPPAPAGVPHVPAAAGGPATRGAGAATAWGAAAASAPSLGIPAAALWDALPPAPRSDAARHALPPASAAGVAPRDAAAAGVFPAGDAAAARHAAAAAWRTAAGCRPCQLLLAAAAVPPGPSRAAGASAASAGARSAAAAAAAAAAAVGAGGAATAAGARAGAGGRPGDGGFRSDGARGRLRAPRPDLRGASPPSTLAAPSQRSPACACYRENEQMTFFCENIAWPYRIALRTCISLAGLSRTPFAMPQRRRRRQPQQISFAQRAGTRPPARWAGGGTDVWICGSVFYGALCGAKCPAARSPLLEGAAN